MRCNSTKKNVASIQVETYNFNDFFSPCFVSSIAYNNISNENVIYKKDQVIEQRDSKKVKKNGNLISFRYILYHGSLDKLQMLIAIPNEFLFRSMFEIQCNVKNVESRNFTGYRVGEG